MPRIALLTILVAVAVVVVAFSGDGASTLTDRDRRDLRPADISPALAGGFEEGIRSAENSVAELSRVAVSVKSERLSEKDPGTDAEWEQFERVRSSPSLFVRMRSNKAISFRDELLNPGDVYIDPASRNALRSAFADAIQRVENLRSMRAAIANEQILAMASAGRFAPWNGNAYQLAGHVSDNPTGEGWYTLMTSDGTQYRVKWEALTWTKEAEQLAVTLEMQIDAMVADFFVRRCGMSSDVRDLVFTYGLGEGPDLLRALARDNPQEYKRIRQILIGH